MSVEAVRRYLQEFGREQDIWESELSTATVELAAAALGTEPARIAKTLAFHGPAGPVVVVAAGTARIDNGKYKSRFGLKAKMLAGDEVEALTGHAPGGVCPFALKEGVEVYLDASLRAFDFVYPACGSANSAIKLTLPELEKLSRCTGWVDVTKSPQ